MAITVKYLGDLGVEKEVAEKIFAERGKEIEADKAKREINNEIFEEARKIDSSFDVKEYASKYGLTNESELFAEAFANSQLGEPNVLGQATNKWLERQGF